MTTSFEFLELLFKVPAGTSRGVMQTKKSWILSLGDGIKVGKGEISIIEGALRIKFKRFAKN
jgi:hypothetical protein